MEQIKLAPSILAADFTRLGEQVNEAIQELGGKLKLNFGFGD